MLRRVLNVHVARVLPPSLCCRERSLDVLFATRNAALRGALLHLLMSAVVVLSRERLFPVKASDISRISH